MVRLPDDRARGDRGAPATLTVRESGRNEAGTHFAIQRESSLAALAHIFPPETHAYPDAAILANWRGFTGRVLLAERGGAAVGVAGIEGAWLHGFYVVPAEWGSGAAVVLHEAAVEAIAGNHADAKLWCLAENGRARRFYERRGWRENGEVRVVPFPPHPLDVGYSLDLSA